MIYNVEIKCKVEGNDKDTALYDLEYYLEGLFEDENILDVVVVKVYSERFEIEKVKNDDGIYGGILYYRVKDNLGEMKSVGFPYYDDAFIICEQLNRLYGNEEEG